MSVKTDLTQAVADQKSAADVATLAASKIHQVANGPDNAMVETDNGPIKTAAKAIKDIEDKVVGDVRLNGDVLGDVAGDSVPDTAPKRGDYYVINEDGTSQSINWEVDDLAVYLGSSGQWMRIVGAITYSKLRQKPALIVTSIVGESDGGTSDSLEAVTPAALGFANAAALNTYLSTNSIIVSVSGYRTPGDGGGGEFYRDANSTDTPNGGTVFDAIGGGRWLRIIKGNYSIAMWGVFPSSDFAGTDHRPIIQGALDYVASLSTNKNRSILEIPATGFSNAYIINSYHPSFAGYGLVCPARVEITGLGAKDQVIFANGDNVALTAIITTTPNADVRRVKWQHLGFNGRFRSQYSAFLGNPLTLEQCPRSEVDDCYFANSLKGQLYVYSFLTVIRRCYAVGYPSTATPGDLPHIGTWIPSDPVNPNYVFGFRATGGTSLHFEQNYANRVDIGFDIDSVYSSGVSNAVDVAELAYVLRGGGIKWHGGAEYVKMLCYSAAETADVSLYGSPVFVTKDLSACEHMSGARTDYLIQVEASCTLKVNALDFRPSSALRDSFPVKNYFYTAGALHLPRFLGTPKLVLTAFPDTYGSVGGRLINDTWVDVELREPGKNSGFYTIEGASGDFCYSFDYDYTGISSSDHPTFRVLSSTSPLNNCNPGKAKAKRYEIDAAFAFTTPDGNSHNIFAKWLLDIRYYADRFGAGVVSGTHDVSPITITSVGHGLTTGNRIHVGGNRNYIGNYSSCTVTGADTFTLPVKFNEAASDTLVWGRPSYTKRVTQVSNDSGIDGKSSGSIGLAIFSSAVEDLFTLRKQTNTFWMNQGKVIEGNHYRIDTLGTLNLGTLFPDTQAADFISNAGNLRATSVDHGLVSGNFVAISGTADYDSPGRYVTVIDADTYDVFSDAARTVAVSYVSDQSGMVNPRIAHPVGATGLLALQTGYPTFGTGILEITFPTPATGLKSRVVIKLKETAGLSESDPLDQPSNISLNKGY